MRPLLAAAGLALAPGWTAAGPAPSGGPAAIAEVDAALDELEPKVAGLLRSLEESRPALSGARPAADGAPSPLRAARQRRYREECRAGLSLGAPGAPGPIRLHGPGLEPARDYYRCMAVARRDPEYCALLDRVEVDSGGGAEGAAKGCRDQYRHLLVYQAMLTQDPRAQEICDENMRPVLGADSAEGCRLILADPPRKMDCAAPAVAQKPDETASCEAMQRVVGAGSSPKPVDCSSLRNDPSNHGDCLTIDLFRRAVAARSPRVCGDSAFCRVLMGAGPAACAGLLERAVEASCEHAAAVRFVAELPAIEAEERSPDGGSAERDRLVKALRSRRDAVEALAARLETLLKDPARKGEPGHRKRAKRHRELARRVAQALRRFDAEIAP